jgi:hypothetical protein
MCLAQIDPHALLGFVQSAALLLSVTVNILTIVVLVSGRKAVQKREVSFADGVVTKEFCESRHGQNAGRLDRCEGEIAALRAETKEEARRLTSEMLREVGKVHDRVNQVLQAVSELRGELHGGKAKG